MARTRKDKDRVLYDSQITKAEDATIRRQIENYGTTGRALITRLLRQWSYEQTKQGNV